jgi:hypothetical protein
MTPYEHSILSVKKFGGKSKHYLKIHKFLDSTKGHLPDYRHRSILHNSWGMLLCEQIFGSITKNNISVREVARQHILEDCQTVPTLKDCIEAIQNKEYTKYNNPNKKDINFLKEKLYDTNKEKTKKSIRIKR